MTYQVIRNRERMTVVVKAEFSFVFRWQDGTIDFYVYDNERLLKHALRDFHLYESPSEASGRIVWTTHPDSLKKIRGG